ncbi:MAG: DUF998 domain-containing protein [Actinophytocola sp.]|nr:DUF998 domain-containing protein [Actinophytocola sp.]
MDVENSSAACDPRTRVTKSLLGYGVLAGVVYVVVATAQAVTRAGFDPARHAVSLLANGDLGWIQIANSGSGDVATTVAFTIAVLLTWMWLALLSVHLYRYADAKGRTETAR